MKGNFLFVNTEFYIEKYNSKKKECYITDQGSLVIVCSVTDLFYLCDNEVIDITTLDRNSYGFLRTINERITHFVHYINIFNAKIFVNKDSMILINIHKGQSLEKSKSNLEIIQKAISNEHIYSNKPNTGR